MQIKPILILALAGCLTHCVSYDLSRQIVQQGNLLPESKINKIHLGMDKETVSQVLGSSLVTPLFNNNHWDYAYTIKHSNDPISIRHISLNFKNNRLIRIQK